MGVIWSVVPESIIHELLKNLSEALIQKGSEGLPERANEQALEGLSRDPNKPLTFSITSLLSPPIVEFSLVLGCSVLCA